MGRLTKDPETRYADGKTTISKFTIAVDRKFKKDDGPSADFFNITAFGKQAEFVEKYFRKGMKMLTIGRVENYSYVKDGTTIYSTQYTAEEVEFAESKKSSEAPKEEPKEEPKDEFVEIAEDFEGLPFAPR